MNTTQIRILAYLKAHPESSAAEISRAFRMTPANIRYHLHLLEGSGYLEVRKYPLPEGRGHPLHRYRLGVQAQPHNLDCLADILLNVAAKGAPDARDGIAKTLSEQLFQRMADRAGNSKGKINLTQRLTYIAHLLEAYQYQARWEAHSGAPRFIFGHCPYLAILASHPELCQMDRLLLEKLVQKPVKQIARIGQGSPASPTCVFTINLQK